MNDPPVHLTGPGKHQPGEDPEAAWWEGFGDPVLTDLIRRAARENRERNATGFMGGLLR